MSHYFEQFFFQDELWFIYLLSLAWHIPSHWVPFEHFFHEEFMDCLFTSTCTSHFLRLPSLSKTYIMLLFVCLTCLCLHFGVVCACSWTPSGAATLESHPLVLSSSPDWWPENPRIRVGSGGA